MTFLRPGLLSRSSVAAALAASLVLTGCGPDDGGEDDAQDSDGEAVQSIPQPEHEDDDTVRIPLALVSPAGTAEGAPYGDQGHPEGEEAPGEPVTQSPGNTQGHTVRARTEYFGCEDTLSLIQTVPMVSDDIPYDAVNFLLNDIQYNHGDPAFVNAVMISDNMDLDSVTVTGDTVTVDLSGEVTTRSYCESWQILKQIETTARVAAGVENGEVLLNGSPLSAELGLENDGEPLSIYEL